MAVSMSSRSIAIPEIERVTDLIHVDKVVAETSRIATALDNTSVAFRVAALSLLSLAVSMWLASGPDPRLGEALSGLFAILLLASLPSVTKQGSGRRNR